MKYFVLTLILMGCSTVSKQDVQKIRDYDITKTVIVNDLAVKIANLARYISNQEDLPNIHNASSLILRATGRSGADWNVIDFNIYESTIKKDRKRFVTVSAKSKAYVNTLTNDKSNTLIIVSVILVIIVIILFNKRTRR